MDTSAHKNLSRLRHIAGYNLDSKEPRHTDYGQCRGSSSALLIDLQGFYAQTTPLRNFEDGLPGERNCFVGSSPNNYGLLGRRISELAGIWDKFRPTIQPRMAPKGDEVASQVSQVIIALKNGKDILDLVDRLEGLYK